MYRSSNCGKCAHCNGDNTYKVWCLSCDPDKTTRWTSGNKYIDDFMKAFQLRTLAYENAIEWIPFDRLSSVEEIGKGGFGSVYKTTWLDGIRKVEKINDGYIHADFHSGNILQDQHISSTLQSYIADLGLFRKANENDTEGKIYGVMPYVAPEVLLGQKFTKAADIYGFGVIMSEMSTGQRPFDGQEFDHVLAIKICNGIRPEFAPGTPDCYIELGNQCMDLDPQKRPNAYKIWNILEGWNESMKIQIMLAKLKSNF
ncbi:kinase-like domain-containing protein [Gigaspora rosea]|uniref:Kinase-like domain-containing protein n=1 Tax=Gigaspora rosea TaxID=44941 RepID=A0A397TUY3_9GLOM|nr:kinase-like domain-containing protein [Gigaspora rosea]